MRKTLKIGLVLLLITGLSGCVFLRLNSFRKQLAKFPKYFSFSLIDEKPVMSCKKPVLFASDLAWLGGLPPSVESGDKKESTAMWNLTKLYPDQKADNLDKENRDISIVLHSEKKKVKTVVLPASFSHIINEAMIDHVFKEADVADLEKDETSAEWNMSNSKLLPTMSDILKVAGKPYAWTETDSEIHINFRYHLEGQETPEDQVDVMGTLAYTKPNRSFIWSDVRVGKIRFSTKSSGKGMFKVKIRRS
ncbi:MAG: hypothetical protein ACI9TH_004781 [Kiritimatiellia bacterium]|jgi:hypothetical protein